jgi:hypothetical protein
MLKSGELTLVDVFAIAETEECVAQMRASDLIAAIPAIGDVKASRIMRQAQIAETRRIRGLGARQRSELLKALAR